MSTFNIGQKVKESGSLNEMVRIKAQPGRIDMHFGRDGDEYILALGVDAASALIARLQAAIEAANIMERGEAKDLP